MATSAPIGTIEVTTGSTSQGGGRWFERRPLRATGFPAERRAIGRGADCARRPDTFRRRWGPPAASRSGNTGRATWSRTAGPPLEHIAGEFGWLPEDGVALTRQDVERIFVDLRALISGSDELEANRALAVDIPVTIAWALERDGGGGG